MADSFPDLDMNILTSAMRIKNKYSLMLFANEHPNLDFSDEKIKSFLYSYKVSSDLLNFRNPELVERNYQTIRKSINFYGGFLYFDSDEEIKSYENASIPEGYSVRVTIIRHSDDISPIKFTAFLTKEQEMKLNELIHTRREFLTETTTMNEILELLKEAGAEAIEA